MALDASGHPVADDDRPVRSVGTRVRRVAYLVLALFVVLFGVQNRAEVPAAWRALHHARAGLVGVAVLAMVAWLANLAGLHAATQRAAGLSAGPYQLLVPAVAGNFLNLITKSGGMAGLSVFTANGRRHRQPHGQVVAAYLLTTVVMEVAFAMTLVVALVVVWVDGRLTRTEVVAGAVFTVYLAARVGLLVVAARSRTALRAVYRLPRRVLRVIRRLSGSAGEDESDARHADELFDAIALLRARPGAATIALAHGWALEALGIVELWAVMGAVGAGGSLVTAVVAYSVSVLFAIVGFLPGGLGFVEVSLAAVLVSFGAPAATATAAVVLYRIFEMWLPMVLGAGAAHVLRRHEAIA